MKMRVKILGLIFVSILFPSVVFSGNAQDIPLKDTSITSIYQTNSAAVKYHAVVVVRDNDVFFRLYRGLRNGVIRHSNSNFLLESKISGMKRNSNEDIYLTSQLRSSYRNLPRNVVYNISDPARYTYKDPIIVYNYSTQTYLCVCIQTDPVYGARVVGRLFRCVEISQNRVRVDFLWDEFRILNKVHLERYNGNYYVRRESIKNIELDTAGIYALLSVTKNRNAELRLIYMDRIGNNLLSSSLFKEPEDAQNPDFFNISAAIGNTRNTQNYKIFVLYAYKNRQDNCLIINEIDNDFTNFNTRKLQAEVFIPDGYTLYSKDLPRVIDNENRGDDLYGNWGNTQRFMTFRPIVVYTCVSGYDNSHRIIVSDVYKETALADLFPLNMEGCDDGYRPSIGTNSFSCYLSFQGDYKINLDGQDIVFNYIFARKMPLGNYCELDTYFLISGAKPMSRSNGYVAPGGISYYGSSGWIGFREIYWGPVLQLRPDELRFTAEVSADNKKINFNWMNFPSDYKIYAIKSDRSIETLSVLGNSHIWSNGDNSPLEDKDVAVILYYKGMVRNVDNRYFMPQVSEPIILDSSPKPGNTGHNDYTGTAELADVSY